MNPRYTVKVKCPYCNNEFIQVFDAVVYEKNEPPTLSIGIQKPVVVLCDTMDTPGCDRYFVVKPTLNVTTVSWAIKD